ncbi:MAG TPA: hypothetical protein VHC44_06250, partial [Verrucomicrobiae bacterium]|nr:hypothetical protein [Verrucomicrobiae bacterium]
MKKSLEIRVYGIDGVTETFFQDDPDLVNRTLAELHPDSLFTRDRIAVADDFLQKTYMPPLIARIDLITDQLSVWDFPFLLGALDELTESEFVEQVRISREEKH